MVEPRIQYAKTSDGVSIAYLSMGEGEPIVFSAGAWGEAHLQMNGFPSTGGLADRGWRVIVYDPRGTGSSDRASTDFSFAAQLRDMATLIDHLQLSAVHVVGPGQGCLVAIAYAVEYPQRVTKLILTNPFAPQQATEPTALARALVALRGTLDKDWEFFTLTLANALTRYRDSKVANRLAATFRAGMSPEAYLAYMAAIGEVDMPRLLDSVTVPTLVVYSRRNALSSRETTSWVASRIPNAELVNAEDVPAAIDEFLRAQPPARSEPVVRMAQTSVVEGALTSRAPMAPVTFASGRYVVSRLLGEGGQKIVFLARDTQLDRDVAIGLLKAEGLDDPSLVRLKREAQAMAQLEAAPHIVAIYDIGEHEGRPFTVCEYLAGGTLEQELGRAGGALPSDRAVAIARDVCHALIVAHGGDIIHRDIKPSNIWLTGAGSAKLGDFGLATALDRSRVTQAGTIMGTAAYMAPEQALGSEIDQRSDVYSLGCVFYEMLTGRPPFVATTAVAVMSQHVNAALVAPSELQPGLPRALERLTMQMLAKAPEDRPQTASEVLAALEGRGLAAEDALPRTYHVPITYEPQVHYCTTEDGVRIAYTVTGSGFPHVFVNDPMGSHVQLEWRQPVPQRLYRLLAGRNMLVRFDPRGVGMSDRVLPMSIDEGALDVKAVVDRLGLDQFSITANGSAVTIVLPYAARHIERVRRVVLVNGYLKNSDMIATPQARALLGAAAGDFELATEVMGGIVYGFGREESRTLGAYIRACIGPELLTHGPILAFDSSEYASAVTKPTLVIRHEGLQSVTAEMTRDLVSRLPDARLLVLPGLAADHTERLADQILAFINEDEGEAGTSGTSRPPAT